MLSSIIARRDENFAHNPAQRGYHVAYRANEVNHCPGCGRTHWYIGRVSAECCFCSTALPLAGNSGRADAFWDQAIAA